MKNIGRKIDKFIKDLEKAGYDPSELVKINPARVLGRSKSESDAHSQSYYISAALCAGRRYKSSLVFFSGFLYPCNIFITNGFPHHCEKKLS